jgi:hypothetical protein
MHEREIKFITAIVLFKYAPDRLPMLFCE